MKQQYQILLVDDHRLLRQALRKHIELGNQDYIVEEAKNGLHGYQLVKSKHFDLIITDMRMPEMDGLELAQKIQKEKLNIDILVLSMMDDSSNISNMLGAGVKGYISKDCDTEELLKAIKTILDGGNYYSAEITKSMMNNFRTQAQAANEPQLSKREKEVLYQILKGLTNQEIATKLFISIRTVETHKYRILDKTDSKTVAGLFRYAIRKNLFPDLLT